MKKRAVIFGRNLLKNRKGISEVIGYILLISISLAMSLIVYAWLKTYIPSDAPKCSDGVSVFLKDYNYDCSAQKITLDLKNSGRFDLAGYFIKATDKSTQQLATKDLSPYTAKGSGGFVVYSDASNLNKMKTGTDYSDVFQLSTAFSSLCISSSPPAPCIFSLEIIPLIYEKINDKNLFVNCGDARVKQSIVCTPPQVCATSNDCVINHPLTPVCKTSPLPSVCVQCLADTDCSSLTSTQHCDTTNNVCVECTASSQCSTLNCDLNSGSRTYHQCIATPAVCGNGIKEGTEACDSDGNNGHDGYCKSDCTGMKTYCGDSLVQLTNDNGQNEVCDLGASNGQNLGCTSLCATQTGWTCTNNICTKNSISLFLDKFDYGPANPLSAPTPPGPWTSGCGVSSCGGQDSNNIFTSNSNVCNADPSCGTYYMVTSSKWAAVRTISTAGYGNIGLSYYRRSSNTESGDTINADYRIGTSGAWTQIFPPENPTNTWAAKTFSFPSTVNNQATIQIRFWLNGGNNHQALWDNVNVSGQVA